MFKPQISAQISAKLSFTETYDSCFFTIIIYIKYVLYTIFYEFENHQWIHDLIETPGNYFPNKKFQNKFLIISFTNKLRSSRTQSSFVSQTSRLCQSFISYNYKKLVQQSAMYICIKKQVCIFLRYKSICKV